MSTFKIYHNFWAACLLPKLAQALIQIQYSQVKFVKILDTHGMNWFDYYHSFLEKMIKF